MLVHYFACMYNVHAQYSVDFRASIVIIVLDSDMPTCCQVVNLRSVNISWSDGLTLMFTTCFHSISSKTEPYLKEFPLTHQSENPKSYHRHSVAASTQSPENFSERSARDWSFGEPRTAEGLAPTPRKPMLWNLYSENGSTGVPGTRSAGEIAP